MNKCNNWLCKLFCKYTTFTVLVRFLKKLTSCVRSKSLTLHVTHVVKKNLTHPETAGYNSLLCHGHNLTVLNFISLKLSGSQHRGRAYICWPLYISYLL